MHRWRTVAVTGALLLAAACSSGSGPAAPTTSAAGTTSTAPSTTTASSTTTAPSTTTSAAPTTTTPSTTTVPPSTTVPVPCPVTGYGRDPLGSTVVPPAAALLVDVRVAHHDCYDRVVFEFRGPGLPEWLVEPSTPPFSGPSGIPVDLAGTSWLRVRFATANAHTDDGEATVGVLPVDLRDAVALTQVQLIEDFEAVVVHVIGTDRARPFRVLALSAPPRLVVDVHTG